MKFIGFQNSSDATILSSNELFTMLNLLIKKSDSIKMTNVTFKQTREQK